MLMQTFLKWISSNSTLIFRSTELTDLMCEMVDNIHKVIITSYKPETKKLTFVNPGQQSKKK